MIGFEGRRRFIGLAMGLTVALASATKADDWTQFRGPNASGISADEKPLHLTAKEYGILELLSLRKGMTLTKEMFLNHLYGGMDEPDLKIIDVFICKLRKKLAQATGGEHYIETVWGRGYVLRDPEAEKEKKKKAANA